MSKIPNLLLISVTGEYLTAYAEGINVSGDADVGFKGQDFNNVSAGAQASLCKVEVKFGPVIAEFNPNMNTSVSAGPNGLEANFFGFGFSIVRSILASISDEEINEVPIHK